ncbi:MAG TPA: hypothetical protein VFV85_01715 [Conexibacter sp.]|nr:hypothetical protein [Conexibacter sp.]
MRFAAKAVPLGVLGCAVALLVACGDGNGLLSGSQSGNLQDALSAVRSACANGDPGRAVVAARSFSDRVAALQSGGGTVDRKLVVNLQQGASTLDALVARSCTGTTRTETTPTATTTTTPTTTATTTTTSTTTTPTEPTTPTTPTQPPPTTPTTPSNGGGTTGPGTGNGNGNGDSGGNPGNPGGAAPGQLKQQGDGQ